ncbi:hypothetical protein FTW19_11095 [Terriglobus albidus]|uniref:Uncharacterized protein n=1 Tax=Terriglobus albidus TaxID=1592106 RepID=A0A5B9E8Q8_9BACT|nr:hypothetical protein [Terriglobus albidus]QEE28498.1 hypothetical protein FTW19_11095 [Terriglobus albidus]
MKLRYITLTGALALASVAIAQQPGPEAGPQGPGMRAGHGKMGPMGRGMGMHHEVVSNAPYSATFTDTRTEKLQDGSVLTHTSTRTVARDTQGRLREEITFEPRRGAKGAAATKKTEVVVFDPVAQTVTRWNNENKIAHVMSLPQGGHRGPGFGAGPQGGPEAGPRPAGFERPGREREGVSFASTDLGFKTMDGLSLSGRKVTRTIAPGVMGNDKEIVVSRESWYSNDLKVMISETDTNPFAGSHTLVTSNLSRNEPAATLFKAPEGYTVQQDQPRFGKGDGRNFGPRRGPGGQQGPMVPQQGGQQPPAGE